MATLIGQLVVRQRSDRQLVASRPAHLVESEVADRVVTRCGREMLRVTTSGTLEVVPEGWRLCKQCD